MKIAAADRHQAVYGSMRALARREPTFALHVHVGVPTPAGALAALCVTLMAAIAHGWLR